jgi:hypothetical protein
LVEVIDDVKLDRTKIRGREVEEDDEEEEPTICLGMGNELKEAIETQMGAEEGDDWSQWRLNHRSARPINSSWKCNGHLRRSS